MAVWGPRVISTPEASEVADLIGAKTDLEAAARFCERLGHYFSDLAAYDALLVDALSTAIGVRYMRCFSSGVRRRLSEDLLSTFSEAQKRVHVFLRDLRNKHLAHSVNAFEESQVTILVREAPASPMLGGLGESHAALGGLPQDLAVATAELCSLLLDQIDALIQDKKAEIQSHVEALPIEQVYALPKPDLFEPRWEAAGRPRRGN